MTRLSMTALRLAPLIVSATLAVCSAGCGGGGGGESQLKNPEVYASYVKSRVCRELDQVTKNSGGGQARIKSLVTTLQKCPKDTVGDDAAIYQELLTGCEQLAGSSDAELKKSHAKIKQVMETAKKLPGEFIGYSG
ncbi:MAG: hypothetical protein ACRCT8_07995 [Lacipirellulaceae bacterium]